jgi:hydroxypyruvate isomerase
MPKFAANLSWLYTDLPFLDRFSAAASDHFKIAEISFPYEHSAEAIASCLARSGLALAMFNAPPGDFAAGERGIAALPGRQELFEASLKTVVHYATVTKCPMVHVMAGVRPGGCAEDEMRRVYVSNLKLACATLQPHGITVLIEPINTRDIPG